MGHPDSGTIQAFLDGELDGPEAEALRSHLGACSECRAEVRGQEESARRSTRALLLLDALDAEPDLPGARKRFRDRLEDRSAREAAGIGARRGGFRSFSLPKAASIALLLTGAAATALPGSPVRSWMLDAWRTFFPPASDTLEEAPGFTPGGPAPSGSEEFGPGAGIPAEARSVEIWVYDLPSGADLQVLWVDEGQAWVRAGEGTRFNLAAGRLEAHSPPGSVRVEIPRSLPSAVVCLDGRVLLRKTGEEVEILGPVSTRSTSEIVFGPSGLPSGPSDRTDAPGASSLPNEGGPRGVSQS